MKKQIIIGAVAAVVLLTAGGYAGVRYFQEKKKNNQADNVKFAKEYTKVTSENAFYYGSQEEVKKLLEHGTGVIYFGFPECPWCQAYTPFLNEVATSNGLRIMYYNIYDDRKENTAFYQEVVNYIQTQGELLSYDKDGNARIYVPAVIFVDEGKIIGFNDESSRESSETNSPEKYWTGEKIDALYATLNGYAGKVAEKQTLLEQQGCATKTDCEVKPAE